MKTLTIYSVMLFFGFFLTGFVPVKKNGTVVLAEVTEGKTSYVLKCNTQYDEANKIRHQYFVEIFSENDPKLHFETMDEYALFTQFNLHTLFEISVNNQNVKVFGSRMEPGLKESGIYRINLYFENDGIKKMKDLKVEFEDQLFENKKIILNTNKN